MMMKHNTDLDGFQKIIQYQFNNIGLLKNALTHSSYANEKKTGNYKDNERLEFLGDAVLELTSSEFIYTGNPDMNEGKMTRLRASIVCEPTLAMCARQIHLQEYIMLGKGEDLTGGRTRDSIISDALEALIGAIYLDGGFANAKEFIHRFVLNDLENKQEVVQAHGLEVEYELTGEEGPEHDKKFHVIAKAGDLFVVKGTGHTKKAAQQQAAYNALLHLKKNGTQFMPKGK
jgi:ribonuclease-3